jgi:hypothetical protein
MTPQEYYVEAKKKRRYAILKVNTALEPDSELDLFFFFEKKGYEYLNRTTQRARRGQTFVYYFRRKGLMYQ